MDLDRINELGFEKSSRWKTVVLVVSVSTWWNLFICIQCYALCMMFPFALAFRVEFGRWSYLRYLVDLCYLFDTVCIITYLRNPKYRKLRFIRVRGWFYILLDIISLVPLELIYKFHYIADVKNMFFSLCLMQNRLLRIYRIFLLESFYSITVRRPSQYHLLMVIQFTSKAILISHVMCCIWVNLNKAVDKSGTEAERFIWYEINMSSLIILNWSGKMETFRESWERLVAGLTIFIGFIMIYAHFYPYTLYVHMKMNYKRALYYDKYRKLQCFLGNMIEESSLKEKILGYFNDMWRKDRADSNLETLLKNIPLALKKEIFSDIYWEAFRHSELFREVSRSCKRSLSLKMTTEYYHSGEVIYHKGEGKLKMMFLVQGIVQVMAEENEESPVLSFSSGTVFGELSLFLGTRSQAIVKCKSYCEVQVLTMKAISNVLTDYPKDKKLIFHNLHRRLSMAKYTQWRKQKFCLEQKQEILSVDTTSGAVTDCVKWIKTQWRAVWEAHERHRLVIKAKEEGFRLPSWHRPVKPDVKIEFISNYLDLIVLSDIFEEKKDAVCLRTEFPWSIDPSAPFLRVWYYFIMGVAFFPSLAYPFCTAWTNHFPWLVYVLSYVVTILFEVDVILKLFTAIKTKHLIKTKFTVVFRQRLQQLTFYLDAIAAFPYQIYIILYENPNKSPAYKIGLLLFPAILKSHIFITLQVPLSSIMDKITVFKNCMISFLLIYWFAAGIQLVSRLETIISTEEDWALNAIANKEYKDFIKKYFLSVVRSLTTAISVPDYYMFPTDTAMLFCFLIGKFFFFFFFCYFLGDFYGIYTVKIYSQETFQVLLNRILKFLENIFISTTVANSLINTVKFQWDYDNADYLSSKISIVKSASFELRRKIYSESTYKTLMGCRMFEDEPLELITDIMERSSVVAVPSGSMLVTFGHTSHMVSILHKGYCRVNSFIAGDVTAGLGYPLVIGPGAVFPMLSSFCNAPAPITVVTLTDCEVIMIHLDDLLILMMKNSFFRDTVLAVKEERLMEKVSQVKPGLSKLHTIENNMELRQQYWKIGFKKFFICGPLCLLCFPKEKVIYSRKFERIWRNVYYIYVSVNCFLWPCCFGLMAYFSHILIPALVSCKIISFIHITLQMTRPYYNKKGILVSHPAYTFWNYMTSSFLLDFIAFFPVFSIFELFVDESSKVYLSSYGSILVLIMMIQNSVKLIHFLGYVNNLETIVKSRYVVRMVKIFTCFVLILNTVVNFYIYLNVVFEYGEDGTIIGFEIMKKFKPRNPDLVREDHLVDMYLYVSYWLLCTFHTTDYYAHQITGYQYFFSYIQSFIGTVVTFYIYAWISSNSIFGNIKGTIFQEKITSFVKHLQVENADDKLVEYAISHYNHEWSSTQGENLKNIFRHLPTHLHEELVYPLYRPTINKNDLFASANEGFKKILAMHMTSVYFNRGAIILFQNEVQSNIYFVHKGKCFVYDWFVFLDVGSVIGDIKRSGVMENKVYALTHVEMLKISSNDFFMILNSFDDLEAEFIMRTKNAENFIKSDIQKMEYQVRPVDSRDVLNAFGLQNKTIGFEDESYFEDPENSSVRLLKAWKSKPEEKIRFTVIYPGTWQMKVFMTLYLTIAFLTILVMPTFFSCGGLTLTAFAIIGVLDFLWLLVIVVNFRVGYIDKTKGDVITDFKFIARNYVKKPDGFFMDLLALLPLEIVPILMAGDLRSANVTAVSWLRMIRIIRGYYFIRDLQSESKKLKSSHFIKWFHIFLILILCCCYEMWIFMYISTGMNEVKNPYELGMTQFFGFVRAFVFTANFISSANICVAIPENFIHLWYYNLNALFYSFAKGWIISKVLSIIYVKGIATAYYKTQVMALESYLLHKDSSPSIVKEVLNYKLNLLLFSRSENMPTFLKKAPTNLRITIMRDFYIHHLKSCPLFEDTHIIFLEQLLARMNKEVYFPGQKIVEQNDVDHRMYFIHRGEVYVINDTKERAYVEYVVGRMYAGEFFGESQGLWFSLPHLYTYRARTVVELIVLHSDDWIDLRRSFPDISRRILEKAQELRVV